MPAAPLGSAYGDLRKVDHYGVLTTIFEVRTWHRQRRRSAYARYRVRIEEMRQSLKDPQAAAKAIPGGFPYRESRSQADDGRQGRTNSSGFDYQYTGH